jgi:N4-(beta-N-acetylglucosaminyl)-L-asparaginase
MTNPVSRRGFLEGVAASAGALGLAGAATARALPREGSPAAVGKGRATGPLFIASGNGFHPATTSPGRKSAIPTALARIADPAVAKSKYGLLEAMVDGVGVTEDDPLDDGVGLGGLPNEAGVVQLDASCLFGPTHQAGSVGAIENIQNPARAALYVLRYTDHCMIVGKGAYDFARTMGLPHRELLTERAHRAWLYWKQKRDPNDDWFPPPDEEVPEDIRKMFTFGTIHMSGLAANGDLAAVTTTSGLAWKIPGRLGDSPIIGAGMYCDNDVGAAGGTGRGEEMIVNCGAHTMVELMRGGKEPLEACLELLKRVVDKCGKRGLLKDGKPPFGLSVYAIRKDGLYGSASLYEGVEFAVGDSVNGARLEKCAWLYDKK